MTHCHYDRQDHIEVYHCSKHSQDSNLFFCLFFFPLHGQLLIFFSSVDIVFLFLGCYIILVPHLLWLDRLCVYLVLFFLFVCLLALFLHGLTMQCVLALNSGYFRARHVFATLPDFLKLLPLLPLCSHLQEIIQIFFFSLFHYPCLCFSNKNHRHCWKPTCYPARGTDKESSSSWTL